jgi:hypothetical protein
VYDFSENCGSSYFPFLLDNVFVKGDIAGNDGCSLYDKEIQFLVSVPEKVASLKSFVA